MNSACSGTKSQLFGAFVYLIEFGTGVHLWHRQAASETLELQIFSHSRPNDKAGKIGRKATDRFQHRNVSALAGKPVVRAGLNRKAFKASPLNKRRVGALPQRKASPGLPRPGARQTQAQKKSMDEPAALKQMRRQNDARQKKLEQDLANLPSPPTHEPKGNSRSSGMMKADAKVGNTAFIFPWSV